MSKVNGGIVVSGTIDGTTIVYDVVVVQADGTPTSLTQYYDDAKVLPDWKNIWQNGTSAEKATLPRIIIRAFDTSSGVDITTTVNMTNVHYGFTMDNDSIVTWDSNNVSKAPIAGLLKKTTFSYNGHDIPAIMVIGNPADPSFNNPDDDRISFDGTVVSGGGQISFKGIGKDVQIRPIVDANAGYSVELHVPLDTPKYIMTNANNVILSTKRVAKLYYNGAPVSASDMTGYTFKFFDITGPTEVQLTNSSTDITIGKSLVNGDMITIGPNAVDCLLTLRCRVYDNTNKELASGTSAVYDLSDPYSLTWAVADNASGLNATEYTGLEPRVSIRKTQTKYFIPKIVTDKGQITSSVTWTFNADDANTGETISGLPGVPSSSGQTYCYLRFEDVVLTDNSGNKTLRPVKLHAQSSEF